MARIAFLGTGAMGSRMASALLRAGHEMTTWNRSPERLAPLVEAGARAAPTPRAAAETAELAFCMVRDDDASRRAWLDLDAGALAGLPEGATAVECSTVTPAWARELAERCAERRVAFLDAPVAGSRPQAEAAQLIFLVGGDVAALARAEPVLRAIGSAVHHAGPAGSGSAVKLAVNALLAVQVAAAAELIGLMRRSGVDAARALEIVAATPVCSPAAKAAAGAMLAGSFAPMFPAGLAEKDLGYVAAMSEASAARTPMAEAARRVFAEAIERGYGDDNMTGVVRLYP